MNSLILKIPVTHKYCDLILNNNFGTRQADGIFHSFIDIDRKYGSEIVYKSIHKLVANTIINSLERVHYFSDKHDNDFETIISMLKNSLLHFRSEISEQLIGYYKLKHKNQPTNERNITADPYILFINPIKPPEITDSIYNSIFNWDLQPKSSPKKNDKKGLVKKIEADYLLMYQFCFEDEDRNNRADWGDLLSGFTRYILYNHSRFHRIDLADTEYIASAFSNIFKKHLEEEFANREIED